VAGKERDGRRDFAAISRRIALVLARICEDIFMKPEWKEFLVDAGAEFAADGLRVESYGNPERELSAALGGTVLCDLNHLGLIAAYGEEARDFLHNQFTNDVRQVDETHSQLNAYCSAKGRMLAIFRLFQRGEAFYLQLPQALLEATLKRLRMFVLRAKVTLEDADDALVRFGLAGSHAEEYLRGALGAVPEEVDGTLQQGNASVIRLPGEHPRFAIYAPLDEARELWNKLNVDAAPVGAEAWDLLEVLAGVPSVQAETVESFVPQMVNLQLVGGVSFRKGCYPGQEIVARMQYLGKLKRRMYLVQIEAETPPAPGTELFAPNSASGQGAGRVLLAARHPDGGCVALVVSEISSAEEDALHLGGSSDGPPLQLRELPYPLDEAGK